MYPAIHGVLTLVLTCTLPNPLPGGDCPQVYRLFGNQPPVSGYNIVIMPDGFTKAELHEFQCAALLLVEDLMASEPFSSHSQMFNIFRIDMVSKWRFEAGCPNQECNLFKDTWTKHDQQCKLAHKREGPGFGAPCFAKPAKKLLKKTFEAKGCTDGICRTAFPSWGGEQAAWKLAGDECQLEPDVLVILVNSHAWLGAEQSELVVATLFNMDGAGQRHYLLAHELGHALGLLDEYDDLTVAPHGSPLVQSPHETGRNIVHENDQEFPNGTIWASECREFQTATPVFPPDCKQACKTSCDPACTPLMSSPFVGLLEGAYYQECDFYRSQLNCRMLQSQHNFCTACSVWLDQRLTDLENALP